MGQEKKNTNELDSLSFETALQELEKVVRHLEEGKLSLEEAITAYERGVKLKDHCDQKLQAAVLKVEQVVLNSQGNVTLKPLDPEQ